MEGSETLMWSISGFEQTRFTAAKNLHGDRSRTDRIYLGDCLRSDAEERICSKRVVRKVQNEEACKRRKSELLGQNRGSLVGEPSSTLRGVRVTGTTLDTRERQLHDEDLSGGSDPRISD